MADLKELVEKAEELRALRYRIEELEESVKLLKEQEKRLAEHEIPELMIDLKLTEVKLADRRKVRFKPFYAGKVIGSDGYNWLAAHGYGDIVKAKLEIPYNFVDPQAFIRQVKDAAEKAGVMCLTNTSVHHMTMGAFLREQIEDHKIEFPKDIINVYKGYRTYIE